MRRPLDTVQGTARSEQPMPHVVVVSDVNGSVLSCQGPFDGVRTAAVAARSDLESAGADAATMAYTVIPLLPATRLTDLRPDR